MINEAIDRYNRQRPAGSPVMTKKMLVDRLIEKGLGTTYPSIMQIFNRIDAGDQDRVNVQWLIEISDQLNITVDELLVNFKK